MQTTLDPRLRDTEAGREADAILRSCVHCGFCLATCPTYQLLGDELDSPRGRIYLMKEMLEGAAVTADTQLHLDRCLTCRSCETTCPSGVRYGRLLDIGRELIEERVARPLGTRLKRLALRKIVPYPRRFASALALARLVRPLLPGDLRAKLPPRRPARPAAAGWPPARHSRKVVLLEGCAQPVLAPEVNLAVARVLDQIGISVIRVRSAGCCGAVAQHLAAPAQTLRHVRHNIEVLWPHVTAGAEAILIAASACTVMLREYGHLLAQDPLYAARATRVAGLTRDVSEIVLANAGPLERALRRAPSSARALPKVAFHSPCTLQHALRIRGSVESLLERAGYTPIPVAEGHLCCGSAGTYSILQPQLAAPLLSAKVAALEQGGAAVIATANIGCQAHIGSGTALPVRHWIELLAERLESI